MSISAALWVKLLRAATLFRQTILLPCCCIGTHRSLCGSRGVIPDVLLQAVQPAKVAVSHQQHQLLLNVPGWWTPWCTQCTCSRGQALL